MHSVLAHKVNSIVGTLVLASALMLALAVIARAKEKTEEFVIVAHQHVPEEVRLVKTPPSP